ncbi:MAG: von Willebrand factor type A domain-containing protein [Kiritimatiellae bacterium]|nr:von Willebrand factor type A domain-containing protein [Kiritimatiellia bacterium]
MNCHEIQDLLTPYLLGDLEPAQAEEVRVHLQTCALCRDSVEDLQATLQLLREGLADTSAVPAHLPADFGLQFKKQHWRRPQVAPSKRAFRNWRFRITEFSTVHFMAVAAMFLILAGFILSPVVVSHYSALRANFESAGQLLVLPPSVPPPTVRRSARIVRSGHRDEVMYMAAAKISVSPAESSSFYTHMQTAGFTAAPLPPPPKAASITDIKDQPERVFQSAQKSRAESVDESEASRKKAEFKSGASVARALDKDAVTAAAPALPKPAGDREQVKAENAPSAVQIGDSAAKRIPADRLMVSGRQSASARLTISAPSAYAQASVPVAAPAISAIDIKVGDNMGAKIEAAEVKRLVGVRDFQKGWAVSAGEGTGSGGGGMGAAGSYRHGGGKAVSAKFAIFQAKYQDGDWNCNPNALNNLMLQIRAWTKNRIDAKLAPEVVDIGTDKLFTLKPPFVYLTGDKDFHLTDQEVKNLRDYLMLGGAVWADNAESKKGSSFDLALRREMKRVLPDRDFEDVPSNHELYNIFFDTPSLPKENSNQEPIKKIDIGNQAAVLYTLDGYGNLWDRYKLSSNNQVEVVTGKTDMGRKAPGGPTLSDALVKNAYKLGINATVYLLTRYQRSFQMLPTTLPPASPAANAIPPPEPAASNAPPVSVPICRAAGVNPFVSAATKPFSTFSIDVDTASYTLSRNYLLRGQMPPPEAVRTEEFVNFFDYDYTPPIGPTFAVYTDCGPSAFGRGMSLLKIGVKGRRLGREEKRDAVLTLLIDTSGSMATPDRIELVKDALSRMVARLGPTDKVAIVQYDSHARLLLEHTPASDKKRILAVIEGLQTSGSTAIEEGMREAYATAARGFNSAACNRVMLLSDGMANLGTTAAEDILKSVADYRKQGITLSVFGFGLGAYNDVMLETLANKGDGVYSFIDSPAEAQRVLVDDLAATVNLIARDAKIQVEFNPKRVKQYRQLGYENRQLKKEEFRDNSVDAGEIGSGQSVTALYELELQGNSREPLGMVRVRCRNALTGQIEEIEQPIAPMSGTTPFEAMDVRFRLAAAAAEFSEILRGSPFAAGRRFEDVSKVLRPVALELSLDNRIQEFLRLTQTGLTPKFQEPENP